MTMGPQSSGRLYVSLALLAGLALLAWRTLEPGKAQQVVWLLLAFFAFRIALTRVRSRYSKEGMLVGADYATSDMADRQELLRSGRKTPPAAVAKS